jgi:hypothetical protein
MATRGHILSVILGSAVALAGCMEQPTGPSPSAVAGVSLQAASTPAGASASTAARGGRPASGGVIYVTGQGLYYDTFVTVDPLPPNGRFQPLTDADMDGIPETPYGPGDPGYLGGRWWQDTNGNGMQDEGDHYFLCPLLGPGRETP